MVEVMFYYVKMLYFWNKIILDIVVYFKKFIFFKDLLCVYFI